MSEKWLIRQTSTCGQGFPAPKGLDKSAHGQSRASRDATLGSRRQQKPISLPSRGYISSAIVTTVQTPSFLLLEVLVCRMNQKSAGTFGMYLSAVPAFHGGALN